MVLNLWPLLLPIAAWSGWIMAQKPDRKLKKAIRNLSKDYVQGLNYLINEQPDKAIDVFLKLVEVDADTVETHLALGGLFRRRGEVERAIRIHQNLIARPQLSSHQRKEALMALGQDYLCAGVFDRAERIFREVTELGGNAKVEGLSHLLQIYQHEKAWTKALDTLKQLQHISNDPSIIANAAHCYCEMAELALQAEELSKASSYIKKAIQVDKSLVRASILQGQLETRQGTLKQAIKAYNRVLSQDPAFISEVIAPLHHCHVQLGSESTHIEELQKLLKQHPRVSILLVLTDYFKRTYGIEYAIDYMSEQLSNYPSLRGLQQLIEWYLVVTYGKVHSKVMILHKITSTLLEGKPGYRCQQCGFSGKHLRWLCPSCKKWSTIKPICGIEGE